MNKNIDDIEFTIFDTETTGLDARSGDRIVEIAAIRFQGGKIISTFSTLVKSVKEISPGAFGVNKITAEMLKDAPGIEEVVPKFLEFIQGSCLCSYNAGFDLEFLEQELKLLGENFPESILVLDVLKMARRLLPGLERYALWFVAQNLGIKESQQHRALSDVEITLSVFKKLKEILAGKGISDFSQFSHLFAISPHFLESANKQKLAQIQEAMSLGVKLKIKYLSSSNAQVTEREVIPKEIKQERGYTYLVGYCCLRQEERSFRIDGILHLEIV